MKNLIVTIIVVLIIALALYYIIKQKKKGVKCIGCPSGGKCSECNSKTCSSKKGM